jgi:signal transduction histidine kinase
LKIKSRLRLNAFISLSVLFLIMFSLLLSFWEISRASRNMDLVAEMRKVALERIVLRDDYLLYGEARARSQWQAKTGTMNGLLESASRIFTGDKDQALLKEARENFDSTVDLFSTYLDANKKEEQNSKRGFRFTESESRLISQVFLKAYSLNDSINRLYESALSARTSARDREALIILVSIIGGVIALVMNSVSVNRMLEKRIAALAKGVEIIGAGNLDYRIGVEGDDELSTLAAANNEMAARLKESYVSVEKLRKEMAEREKKEREVEEKNSELERFTYTVSHDLKSPLVTIKTFLGYLEQDMRDSNEPQVAQDIGYMHTAADKMGQLLEELLEMSRIGRVVNPPVNVTFHELAKDALDAVAGSISERGVEVRVDEEEISLYGDRRRLVEIWQNLIENSVKYMGDRDFPLIEVGVERDGEATIFFVRDNGIGIDPRYKEKIFGLFEKLDPKSEGSGLGLALVKRIVALYHGSIRVESEPGKGACFRFTLPEAISRQTTGETI